jgi:hypothetical protein
VLGSAVGIVASGVAFAWMVTGGTFRFLSSLPFSSFYDVQARALLHGTWSMPANVLTIEGIRTDGRTDMYYGPVPALLRIPVVAFTHRFDGRLTEPSLLIAFVLALAVASLLCWRIRGLVRPTAEVSRLEAALTSVLVTLVGVGSVFFFLSGVGQVYEEAEMWGATLALAALFALLGFLQRPSGRHLLSTGVLTTLAVLTRVSVGIGPLLAMAMVSSVYLFVRVTRRAPAWRSRAERLRAAAGMPETVRPGRFGVLLLVATVVPIALYVAINEAKFDTPFSIPLNHQVISLEDAHRQAVLAANGGSLFGLKFLPTNLLQFARPDALIFTRSFPWVFFPGKAVVVGHLLYDTRDWTSSVPASMPVLFLLAVVGVVAVYRRRHRLARSHAAATPESLMWMPSRTLEGAATGITTLRIPLLGAAAGTAGILTIAFIAQRYLADAMPLLLLAALCGWHVLIARHRRIPVTAGASVLIVLSALAVFELWTSFSLALFYQRELGPAISIPQRAGMVSFQDDVDRTVFGAGPKAVRFVPLGAKLSLPKSAGALDLAVVGNCAAVYQFTGSTWQPVEVGAGGGATRLEVSFAHAQLGRRQPLVVTGGDSPQDVLAVTWDGDDRYSFSYLFAGSMFGGSARRWITQTAVSVPPGPHQLQVDLLSGVGQVFVTLDDAPVFSALYPVAAPVDVKLGTAPTSVGTTGDFAGSIHPIEVPTPICDRISR